MSDPLPVDENTQKPPPCSGCGSYNWDGYFDKVSFSMAPHGFFEYKNIDSSNCCERCSFLLAFCHRHIDPSQAAKASLHREWFIDKVTSVNGVLGPCPSLQLMRGAGRDYPRSVLVPVDEGNGQFGIGARILSPDVIDYAFIKRWMKTCEYRHRGKCQKPQRPVRSLPELTVIDCDTKKLVPYRFGHQFVEPRQRYVTLSYIWGSSEFTDQDSIAGASLPDDLPRVVQDAITVVAKLGFKYLWIDRYCIPQDDPSARNIQIHQMGEIYARSALTIIAGAGTGPGYGLPGVSLPRKPQLSGKIGKYTFVDLNFLTTDMYNSPWNTRAWTFQEGLLSTRRLVFTDTSVYFQCGEMHCYENLSKPIYHVEMSTLMAFDGDRVFTRIFPVSNAAPGELINRIEKFYNRQMSVDGDVLNALAGIFAQFRDRPRVSRERVRRDGIITRFCDTPMVTLDRVDTLCGLPIYGRQAFHKRAQAQMTLTGILVLALSWSISGGILRRKEFPSWSWAGWKPDRTPDRIHLAGVTGSHSLGIGPLRTLINRQGWMTEYHAPPVAFPLSIEVLAGNGVWVPWEERGLMLLDDLELSENVKSLRIRGWTCLLEVERKESNWSICSPEKLLDKYFSLKNIDESDLGLPSSDGSVISLKALLLNIGACSASSYRSARQTISMLILREVGLNNYERIALHSHSFEDGEVSYGPWIDGFEAKGVDFQLETLEIV
ncbi:heterokaryon incompatibility protein-domain-containing protein [Pyrenochaeta sp. MPI-SDFR-AT-0127]|nr:heterokaryon incompatibility protein-domain-containing protein [Pyrenochaeta sp. MPI-SDFR-AT-0127]